MNRGESVFKIRAGRGGRSRTVRVLSACSRIVILAIALSPVNAKPAPLEPVNCFDLCEQTLVSCLQAAHGNPTLEARCQDNYDACCENCLLLP